MATRKNAGSYADTLAQIQRLQASLVAKVVEEFRETLASINITPSKALDKELKAIAGGGLVHDGRSTGSRAASSSARKSASDMPSHVYVDAQGGKHFANIHKQGRKPEWTAMYAKSVLNGTKYIESAFRASDPAQDAQDWQKVLDERKAKVAAKKPKAGKK